MIGWMAAVADLAGIALNPGPVRLTLGASFAAALGLGWRFRDRRLLRAGWRSWILIAATCITASVLANLLDAMDGPATTSIDYIFSVVLGGVTARPARGGPGSGDPVDMPDDQKLVVRLLSELDSLGYRLGIVLARDKDSVCDAAESAFDRFPRDRAEWLAERMVDRAKDLRDHHARGTIGGIVAARHADGTGQLLRLAFDLQYYDILDGITTGRLLLDAQRRTAANGRPNRLIALVRRFRTRFPPGGKPRS